jgi:hypothetical protein
MGHTTSDLALSKSFDFSRKFYIFSLRRSSGDNRSRHSPLIPLFTSQSLRKRYGPTKRVVFLIGKPRFANKDQGAAAYSFGSYLYTYELLGMLVFYGPLEGSSTVLASQLVQWSKHPHDLYDVQCRPRCFTYTGSRDILCHNCN